MSWASQGDEHHCNCAQGLCDLGAGGWLGAEEKPVNIYMCVCVNIVFGYIGYMNYMNVQVQSVHLRFRRDAQYILDHALSSFGTHTHVCQGVKLSNS